MALSFSRHIDLTWDGTSFDEKGSLGKTEKHYNPHQLNNYGKDDGMITAMSSVDEQFTDFPITGSQMALTSHFVDQTNG